MKLLELTVENLPAIPDGTCSFAAASGGPLDVVALTGDAAGNLLQTIAALLEAVRAPAPAACNRAWWAHRRGAGEARIRARWAFSEGEAARAGVPSRTAVSEWRVGPDDQLPREVAVEPALPQRTRADVARYLHVDASEIAVWMGADPLAELVAGIARQDVAATRVSCRRGEGIVAWSTPDTFARVNRAIAPVCPGLRLARVACAPGEAPVACLRDEEPVDLDQLADAERDAIHFATRVTTARVRNGVVLVGRPDLHVPREARGWWLEWLAGLVGDNQLVVAMASPEGLAVHAASR